MAFSLSLSKFALPLTIGFSSVRVRTGIEFSAVRFTDVWTPKKARSVVLSRPTEVSSALSCSRDRLVDEGPFSSSPQAAERPLSTPLSPGDRWCDILGFVHADSVSSSSTVQIFRDVSHVTSACLLGHLP